MSYPSFLQTTATWDTAILAQAAAAAFVTATLFFALSRRAPSLPLPPGPPSKPLLGNLLDIPPADGAPWLKWSEWAQTYGDVVHLEVLGKHIIILSSPEACDDLLVKRGATYSDRPTCTMANLCGFGQTTSLESHNDRLRTMRRMYTPLTSPRQVLSFVPLVERATHELLRKVSASTDGSTVPEHLRWFTGSIILKIVFGYTIEEKDDPFVRDADRAMKHFSASTSPGWLVDVIPFLRHLPLWTPGLAFLRQAELWRKEVDIMFDDPFNHFTRQMATGDYPSQCMVAKLLEQDPDTEQRNLIKHSLGTLYGGGSDTTVIAMQSFFLAMVLHPDIQRRAQAELDAVTGCSRLPTYADRQGLVYVNSIVKEVMRWNPVAPGGFPHASRTDDVYRGWRIPAGSIFLPNVWELTHDANRFTNPMSFDPDRFLGSEPASDPVTTTFGFGRRLCPGNRLADMSLFLAIANTLATFDIFKQVDQNGVEITPEIHYSGGTLSHPAPFPFKVTPRSEKALELLQSHK